MPPLPTIKPNTCCMSYCYNDSEEGEVLCLEHIEGLFDAYFEVDPWMEDICYEGWISPDGTFYGHTTDRGGHDITAAIFGYESVRACEESGWLHIEGYAHILNWNDVKLTDAQGVTLQRICDIGALQYPFELLQWLGNQDRTENLAYNLRPHWSVYVTYGRWNRTGD